MNKRQIVLIVIGISIVAFSGGYIAKGFTNSPQVAKENLVLPINASTTPNSTIQKYAYESVPVCNEHGFCLKLVNYLGLLQKLSSYPDGDFEKQQTYASTTFATDPLTRFLPGSDNTYSYCRSDTNDIFNILNQIVTTDKKLERFYRDDDLCNDIVRDSTAFVVTDSNGEIIGVKNFSDPGIAEALLSSDTDYWNLKLDSNNNIIFYKHNGQTCASHTYSYQIKYHKDLEIFSYGDPVILKEEDNSGCE